MKRSVSSVSPTGYAPTLVAGPVVLLEGRDVGGMACQIKLSADFVSSDARHQASFAARLRDTCDEALSVGIVTR